MDLFHANGLKAHRNSFETTIENVTNEIKHIEHYSGNGNSQTPTTDTF